jgi:hypothetical protein
MASIVATHNVSGKVASAHTRSFTSKAGKALTKTVIVVDGNEIELEGFGDKTGTYPPGREVNIGVAREFGRWNHAGLAVVGLPQLNGAPNPVGSTPGSSGGGGAKPAYRGGFPVPSDDYQTSIIRQNALTNAVATLATIVPDATLSRAFPVKGPDGNFEGGLGVDVPAAMEGLAELVIRLAYRYAAFSSGRLDTEAIEQITSKILGATKSV